MLIATSVGHRAADGAQDEALGDRDEVDDGDVLQHDVYVVVQRRRSATTTAGLPAAVQPDPDAGDDEQRADDPGRARRARPRAIGRSACVGWLRSASTSRMSFQK